MQSTLERLCSLTKLKWGAPGSEWNDHFDPIGLILQLPPRREEYWCTPKNSTCFARTGGDGTHFSILHLPGTTLDSAPVVMTVPMSDNPNVVVGENVLEFLALGCRRGYFSLEQLVFDHESAVLAYSSEEFDPESSQQEQAMLKLIAKEFGLHPWQRLRARFAELQLRYRGVIETTNGLRAG